MVTRKYSKSASFYLSAKSDFFSRNDALLKKALEQNRIYASQPKRDRCKLCQSELQSGLDFFSHGVGYIFCEECNHLNGEYEDTAQFVEEMYMADNGEEYAFNYIDTNFQKRATDVYLPKVDFLEEALPSKAKKILDIGCGSGYFVLALGLRNLEAQGIDVSESMVSFGNSQIREILGSTPLESANENDFFEIIKFTDADVVSAIGVIEHLRQPHQFFEAFKASNARYLFYSVPMFSLSAILENISSDVFPRQLSGGHTHLFTEESISQMHRILGVSALNEWRFGTDIMDLYRHILVRLDANVISEKMSGYIDWALGENIDALQRVLDSHHSCSEIHVVAAKD